jgi:hypothetical protein
MDNDLNRPFSMLTPTEALYCLIALGFVLVAFKDFL